MNLVERMVLLSHAPENGFDRATDTRALANQSNAVYAKYQAGLARFLASAHARASSTITSKFRGSYPSALRAWSEL